MDAGESINSLEGSLRGLVRAVLGNQWAAEQEDLRVKLEDRRAEEIRRRDGAVVTNDLLEYTHVYELRKLIAKNWEKFSPALMEKKRFDVYMDRVEDFRNVPMHSRELLPFEERLLEGIAGEIRNLVTIYRSQLAPDGKHYPVVESIVDSFGTAAEIRSSWPHVDTGVRLQVGDEVTFQCRAWDPQDRELTWSLDRGLVGGENLDSASGNSVILTWRVGEKDVAERSAICISLKSSGKFHRNGSADTNCSLIYAVEPPAGI